MTTVLENRGVITVSSSSNLKVNNLECSGTSASVTIQAGSVVSLSAGATTTLQCLVTGLGQLEFTNTLVFFASALVQVPNIHSSVSFNVLFL